MDYRQVTPPVGDFETDSYDLQCPGGSAGTNTTYLSNGWSPESLMTTATTPPKSPFKFGHTGPALLPRVRAQDQLMEPSAAPSYQGHLRTTSLPSNGFPMQFGGQLPSRPDNHRRSTSPPAYHGLISPASTSTPNTAMPIDVIPSRRPSMSQMRSSSASNLHTHSRNSSSGSIDASMLSRYGYPTYRHSPTPQPTCTSVPMSRTPSAMSHLTPIALPGGQVASYPQRRRTASPPANPSRLSMELEPELDPALDVETSTLLEYLTKPNPAPSLCQRTIETRPLQNTSFWFDIRNLRSWSDFNASTIAAVPGFLDLLKINIGVRSLPTPGRVNLSPETAGNLAELCANHHAVKVNAALRISQGDKHVAIRALTSAAHGPRQQPDFVANYQSDAEKTIYGDGRGRVIGMVQCFDQWNTGMRNESPNSKIQYLRTLAQLHRYMREHGCRYGFIMTEIELVCVRAGGPVTEASQVPLFGHLELAPAIQVSTLGLMPDGSLQMTADLALWYLHMLAKEEPLPGQYSWRMDVGGPAALSRQHHMERDDWIPKVHQSEKREAKRVRGWVFPDEPLHKRELGKAKRVKRS